MNYRDWLQQVIYKIINPIVRGMIKIGITPNFITTTGLILNIVAAGIFIYAGLVTDSEEDLSLVGWTGGLILFAGLFDMMDGRVARLGNMSSTFGALIGSLMVSYVRARAEGLGLECKVGIMQRPERVVLTSLGALFCGIFSDCTLFDPMLILIVPLAIIAVLANLTAFVRLAHCYKLLNK